MILYYIAGVAGQGAAVGRGWGGEWEIARRCQVKPDAVRRWRARFAEQGVRTSATPVGSDTRTFPTSRAAVTGLAPYEFEETTMETKELAAEAALVVAAGYGAVKVMGQPDRFAS
jgi:hypothetical protein